MREAGHSAPSGAEVKNVWSHSSIALSVLLVWCAVEARLLGILVTELPRGRNALLLTLTLN